MEKTYDVALCGQAVMVDGSHYVQGNIYDRKNALTAEQVMQLPAVDGKVWVVVGFTNPSTFPNYSVEN